MDEKQLQAFRAQIDAILEPTVLAPPRRDLPYSIDTDASNYGMGCVLSTRTKMAPGTQSEFGLAHCSKASVTIPPANANN